MALVTDKAREQIAQGSPHPIREPPPAPVLFAVMQDVTSLAERGKVPRTVVGRIMIEMSGRQGHVRRAAA